jgi:hypothetical protein
VREVEKLAAREREQFGQVQALLQRCSLVDRKNRFSNKLSLSKFIINLFEKRKEKPDCNRMWTRRRSRSNCRWPQSSYRQMLLIKVPLMVPNSRADFLERFDFKFLL